MADIVQILKEMQQEEDCPMLVHQTLRERPRPSGRGGIAGRPQDGCSLLDSIAQIIHT